MHPDVYPIYGLNNDKYTAKGSGFTIQYNNHTLLLTAAHVSMCGDSYLRLKNGYYRNLKNSRLYCKYQHIEEEERHDLAIYLLPPIVPNSTLKFSSHMPEEGTICQIVGYKPLLDQQTDANEQEVTLAVIDDCVADNNITSGALGSPHLFTLYSKSHQSLPGLSGGLVIDNNNAVIGCFFGGSGSGSESKSIRELYATRFDHIAGILKHPLINKT